MKKIVTIAVMAALFSGTAFSVELLKADFSGTPGSGSNTITIPAADAQLTVHSNILNEAFVVYGGTANTTNWVYNGDGDALLNTDLFTGANWGNPTRMDLGLLLAEFGKTYTITNIEVDVTATNATDVSIDLWAARDPDSLTRVHTPAVVIPAGTTGTFVIDTSLMHLVADANEATWNQAGNGDLRLGFFSANGTNVDSIAIGEVRVNGIVEDYVAPVVQTNTLWNFNTLGDTEGWSQDVSAHIDGLDVLPAFSGTETVLTADGITGNDPQVIQYGLFGPALGYWDEMIIRIRQLDSGGSPLLWNASGCAVVLGDDVISTSLGGSGWDVVSESGEWIVATYNIASLGSNQLEFLRFDPVGQFEGTNKLFEVDYVQLTSAAAPPIIPDPDPSYWEFNTNGVLEGWSGSAHISGLSVSNGLLFSQAITGGDPQLLGPSVSPSTWYWTTAELRVRQLDTGGTPLAWDSTGCSVVINGTVLDALGGAGWDVVSEAGEWIVTTLDISQFGSSDINSLRFDPVGSPAGTNKNFEVDYIRLDKSPIPIPPETSWEFNTDGDLEGWTGDQITDLSVSNGIIYSQGLTGGDPKLNRSGIISSKTYTWTTAEMRVRHLDSGGTPTAFSTAGLTAVIGGKIYQGARWEITPEGSGEWVVAKVSLAYFEDNDINGLRLDPVGSDATKNFEVDYIRLNYSIAPLEKNLAQSWEFNTGTVEGLTGNAAISGLLATDAYSGGEKVLTCADVTGNDPQVNLPSPAGITPTGGWSTLEFRVRQLSANGGPFQAWDTSGTLLIVNGVNLGGFPGANVTTTSESDGWVTAVADISALGFQDLNAFRLDPVGNDQARNFEIDYIRAYSATERIGYDVWTYTYGLTGGDAAEAADPDNDLFDNAYEYAFGGNPQDAMDTGLLPVGSVVDSGGSNVLEYVYFRRSDPDSGLDYSIESSVNLILGAGGWSEYAGAIPAGSGTFNSQMEAVTNLVPTVDSERFLRVKAVSQ